MDSRRAEKFEKHRKEARKKAFLNLAIILLAVTGLGFYFGGYALNFLAVLLSFNIAVIFSGLFATSIILIWAIPFFHYREEVKASADKGPETFLERDLEESPMIKALEEKDWEEVKSEEDKVVLETFPSLFHRLIRKKTTLILEQEEKTENSRTTVMRTRKKDISRTRTVFKETDEGTEIDETTVSLSRVSPVYLEVTMYLEPELQRMTEDTEKDLEIEEESIDFGLNQYSIE